MVAAPQQRLLLPVSVYSGISKPSTNPNEVRILCIDLTHYNATTQFLVCCGGVFFFFLMYGYLQELIFTLDGFKPYGWFLTLVQFAYYTGFGFFERRLTTRTAAGAKRHIPLRTYALLAFLTLGTMGLSNASLSHLNYPTQVIFKCCKLVPVLVGSIVIQKKAHGPLDFLAALAMCVGLTLFTLGECTHSIWSCIPSSYIHNWFVVDSKVSPNFNTYGVLMISTALLFDAVIGNVQEKAMREYNAPNNEVVLYSYGIGFVYLFVAMLLSGNIMTGLRFCATVMHTCYLYRMIFIDIYIVIGNQYPIQTYGYAFLFSLTGYLGIQIVLTLVRTCGAPLAATVTTARKAITIAISFLLFSKPFSWE